jgi:Bacterial aa3 type cytochrome c oxidase subunit IV
MASQPRVDGTAPMDYAEHEKTYELFLGLTKWGSIAVVAILVLMAYFLL